MSFLAPSRRPLGPIVSSLSLSLVLAGCFEDAESESGSGTDTAADTGELTSDTVADTGETEDPTSDPTNDPTVDPTAGGCLGCLDAAGGCLAGDLDQACGALAVACVACEEGTYCDAGTCTPLPACNPDNCDGCCEGDDCVPGEALDACGSGGVECSQCMDPSICNEGACQLPCADNCDGCCDASGDCIALEDTTDNACGQQGESCSSCDDASQCESGTCISTECAMSCDGCCDGSTCLPGTAVDACGQDGSACAFCPLGNDCQGSCMAIPGATWNVVIESAELAKLAPDGTQWDGFGLPDPYLELTIGKQSDRTATAGGMLVPVWNEVVLEAVPTEDLLVPGLYAMFDDDSPLGPDDAGACMFALEPDQFGIPLIATCMGDDGSTLWTLQFIVTAAG